MQPDRPDELARIEEAGGRVIYRNGARVDGVLAMSRAIGDKYFKPAVISDPEMNILNRHPQDECLIIATDGLWDVVTNDMACNVARNCLMKENPTRRAGAVENGTGGASEENPESHCSLAANLLARLALARGSADNISVIVVDLRRSTMPSCYWALVGYAILRRHHRDHHHHHLIVTNIFSVMLEEELFAGSTALHGTYSTSRKN